MRYDPHNALTKAAVPTNELWRTGLGIVVIGAVTIATGQAIFALLQLILGADAARTVMADSNTGQSAGSALLLLASTGALGLGAVLAVRSLHRRAGRSLIGPVPLAIQQFLRVLAAVGVILAVISILPPYGIYTGVTAGLPFAEWLMLLPLSLLVLLIQTGSEELVFRGYLQQQIAARFAHPVAWLTLPSLLFAVGHYSPGIYGSNAVWVVLWSFLFGLAMADLTARAGTLGPAIAVHLANNAWAILLLAPKGDLSGLALFHLPFGPEDEAALAALLPAELMMIAVTWLTARLALRR